MAMADTVTDNQARSRFELDIDGQIVFALYRREPSKLVIRHVEAPPALRGTGAADRLMRGIMGLAQTEGAKITPLCSYAAVWMRRHKEFASLLA
jgi:uncharacterized protein